MSLIAGLLALALLFQVGILVEGQGPNPMPSVMCYSNGSVTISIVGLEDLPEWVTDQGSWNLSSNASCPPSVFDTGSGMVAYEEFYAAACAADVLEKNKTIDYIFTIDAEVPGHGLPTRTYRHQYTFTCIYNSHGEASATYIPLHVLSGSAEDYENFTFSLTLSPDTPDIPLGEPITATVRVAHTLGVPLDLLLKDCYTTAAVNPANEYLIEQSCPTNSNPNVEVTSYNCTEQTGSDEVFVFSAFRYSWQTQDDYVTLTCTIHVCLADNETSICQQECDSCSNQVRKRRDTEFQDMTIQVYSRPFRVVNPELEQIDLDNDHEEQEEEPATGSSTSLIIGLCVGGIAAVAIVCVAVIILMRRRSQNLPVTDTQSPGSYVNQSI